MTNLPLSYLSIVGVKPSGALIVGREAIKPAKADPIVTLEGQINSPKLSFTSSSHSARDEVEPIIETVLEQGETDLLGARLFDARANAKRLASQVSMHLPAAWRSKVYKQLDDLLDAAEWDVDDELLNPRSVQTFLRFVIFADVSIVPSLGMSNAGNLVAVWRTPNQRATIEFRQEDRCHLVLSDIANDDPAILTFMGPVSKAKQFLQREQFALG